MRPPVLSLAGSDPGGGAGLQQDLKVFQALGCHGMAIETLLTVQTQKGLREVHPVPPAYLENALTALLQDLPPLALKIGALASPSLPPVLAPLLPEGPPVVLDPILGASRGQGLGQKGLAEALRCFLLPHCALVTPNLDEAEALTGDEVRTPSAMDRAARRLVDLGARAALVKGGHLPGEEVVDVLWDGQCLHRFVGPRFPGPPPHGTGCTLSAAITCHLAKGNSLHDAISRAKALIRKAWPSHEPGEEMPFLEIQNPMG